MITNDLKLLASLHDIMGGEAYENLKKQREDVLVAAKSAVSDRLMNQAIGALRVLDDLIDDIETAHDRMMELHEQQQVQIDMSQAF